MASTMVRVGELACQKDSFLRELLATVISCEPAKVAPTKNKKNEPAAPAPSLYDVILSDSVLFPEGGGQPCDYGTLEVVTGHANENKSSAASQHESIPITQVRRVADTCVLTSPVDLPPGTQVRQRVDWPRRLDHMHHHTAQHLLTAIVERSDTLRLPTVSWSLTHPFCFIQLDTAAIVNQGSEVSPYASYITKSGKISDEMVAKIEQLCNDAIMRATSVRCDVFDSREAYEEEQARKLAAEGEEGFRSRGIPLDVSGPIRVISLDKIDSCTCCGTHLHDLAQLQALYLLHQETKGTTVKLYFVTGTRAAAQFHHMYHRERQLMPELGGSRPEDFVDVVTKRSKDAADMEKKQKKWMLELAGHAAADLSRVAQASMATRADPACPTVVALRRDDVDMDFFTAVRKALDEGGMKEVVLVSAWAMEGGAAKDVQGQVSVNGGASPAAVEEVAEVVKAALTGVKGGTSKMGFRGKGSLKEWDALVKTLAEKYP